MIEFGCKVDFSKRGSDRESWAMFDVYLDQIYEAAKIPKAKQDVKKIQGTALGRKDDAYFELEREGVLAFNDKTKTMTSKDC